MTTDHGTLSPEICKLNPHYPAEGEAVGLLRECRELACRVSTNEVTKRTQRDADDLITRINALLSRSGGGGAP